MKIFLSTMGTRGDIQPYVALGTLNFFFFSILLFKSFFMGSLFRTFGSFFNRDFYDFFSPFKH